MFSHKKLCLRIFHHSLSSPFVYILFHDFHPFHPQLSLPTLHFCCCIPHNSSARIAVLTGLGIFAFLFLHSLLNFPRPPS
ncbi:hypothetical protein BDV12DRAFT_164517 [Aspergillus spectabilis]